MWHWLRQLFSSGPAATRSAERGPAASPLPLDESRRPLLLNQLYVQPDDGEDFDKEACERLIATISTAGSHSVDDANVFVTLEDFFVGNRCKHSIAANVVTPAPYDTAQSWFELLKQIRATSGIHGVTIEIIMIEPYADGRVGMWPYADTIWIHSSLDQAAVAALVAPLEPDEVCDASDDEFDRGPQPPFPATVQARPYRIWWD